MDNQPPITNNQPSKKFNIWKIILTVITVIAIGALIALFYFASKLGQGMHSVFW